MEGQWKDPIYWDTVLILFGTLLALAISLFFLRKKTTHLAAGWASVKSWLFLAPFLLLLMGLPIPWILGGLTFLAILGVKSFFQITGMYHRNYFVIFCYSAIIALPFLIHHGIEHTYNVMPMILMALTCLVPLIRNSYKKMIQFIALTLLAYSFLGWSFMHLGKLLYFDKGPYLVIYIILLTEVCDNVNLAFSRLVGKNFKPFSQISPRRSLEGFLIAIIFTFFTAWAIRHMMPLREPKYWISAALVASLVGGFGDITMSVIRRDLGIKDVGLFILGRGDIMSRLDKLIFVAPIYYYTMKFLLEGTGFKIWGM